MKSRRWASVTDQRSSRPTQGAAACGDKVRRPRSRKRLYRAGDLLALDAGKPIEEDARQRRTGSEGVEGA